MKNRNERIRAVTTTRAATTARSDAATRSVTATQSWSSPYWAGCMLLVVCGLLQGCDGDETRKLRERVHHVEVGVVRDAGLTLDEQASPGMVVYALLVTIHDDVKAGKDVSAREDAFKRTMNLSAPDQIHKQDVRGKRDRETTVAQRDRSVEDIVWRWAPTLGYYVDDFPKTWEDARTRLIRRPSGTSADQGPEACVVKIALADPSGDAKAMAVAQFRLVKEKGFWRVVQVGFDKKHRSLKTR